VQRALNWPACTSRWQAAQDGSKPGEGRVEIVPLEDGAVLRIDVFRGVTLGALQLRMFPFQLPSRLRVIEFFLGNGPSHQPVFQPVVLRVAARAVVAALAGFHLGRMVAALFREAVRDLLVAAQAAELSRSRSEHVAFSALQRPIEILVRPAERTGRHLCEHFRYQSNESG